LQRTGVGLAHKRTPLRMGTSVLRPDDEASPELRHRWVARGVRTGGAATEDAGDGTMAGGSWRERVQSGASSGRRTAV